MGTVSRVRVTGPLSEYREGFAQALAAQGYTPLSAANQVRLLASLSRWLVERQVPVSELTRERIEEFLRFRRDAGYTCWLSPRGLSPLLGYLRSVGVAPAAVETRPEGPVETLLGDYRAYLIDERGLVASTVVYYLQFARLFLSEREQVCGELALETLTGRDVVQFVQGHAPSHSVGSAKLLVTALRSLLRFLHVDGYIEVALASVVPAVAGWRGSSLPLGLEADEVARLLASCDRRRHIGRRDHAILLLLIRLGLRAAEVATLGLDDIDWRAGEIVVHGKGKQQDRLPLPVDVGESLAGYLRRGRPRVEHRAVFVQSRAPYASASASTIQGAVRAACRRAGMAELGTHRLRHTAATQMLHAGAPLAEIAQVMRHREVSTTAIYAKVDHERLVTLASPWPGSGA
jgi:integrase/recombinase XerD